MKQRILLIGYNYAPEPTGIGKYNGEMMAWLARRGYDCTVVTAYPYYPHWRVQPPYAGRSRWYRTETQPVGQGATVRVHRCPMYVPAAPSGLKRTLLDASFTLSAGLKILGLLFGKKFDLVITVAPSFQFGLLGLLYRRVRGGRWLYHVQDLQIEAARDLGMIRSPAVLRALFGVERYLLRRADFVSSISEPMVRTLAQKAARHVDTLPNWADTAAFYPLADRAALKTGFGLAPTDRVVLYAGAIGAKQGLELILHAAHAGRARADIKFLIAGSGPYKEKLEAMARALKLTSVTFVPIQPADRFNAFLNMADLHLIIQKADAGDLVMPSKLTTVLAVGGLALVTANPGSGLHTLVSTHRLGVLVEAENQEQFNEAVRTALDGGAQTLRANARAYAEAYLAIDATMQRFVDTFLADQGPGNINRPSNE